MITDEDVYVPGQARPEPVHVEPLSLEDEQNLPRVVGRRSVAMPLVVAVALLAGLVLGVLGGHSSARTVTTAGPVVTVTATDQAQPSTVTSTTTVTRQAATLQTATTQTVTRQVTVVRRELVAGPTRTVRAPGPVRVVVVRVTATVVGRRR